MNKKIIALITAAAMAVPCLNVCAAGITQTEIGQQLNEAMDKNDKATVKKLINIDMSDVINETVDAKVIVSESEIIREANDAMLGMQVEASGFDNIIFTDGTTELSNDYKQFANQLWEVPLYRLGGASAEVLNLSNNIGPFQQRKASLYVKEGRVPSDAGKQGAKPALMGPLEFAKFVQANNPEADIIYCMSMNCATPEDSAKVAAYLTHRADESEWGALRASHGMVEPVNVFAYELGNEIYAGLRHSDETLAWYPPVAKAHMDAIREVDPDAKFIICGIGCPWEYGPNEPARWREWTIGVLKQLVELGETQFDYMSAHPYYDGVHTPQHEIYHQQYTEDVASVLGEDNNLKFIFTEQSTWTHPFNRGHLQSLDDSLSIAQWMNRMYHYTNIYGANYHNIMTGEGTMWALYRLVDGKLTETLISEMFRVYQKGVGDRIVKDVVESENPITDVTSYEHMKFTTLASPKGKRELNLILCNDRSDVDFNLTFEFENNYTLVEETVFTAPNMRSFIYDKDSLDIGSTTVTEKNEKNFSSYHMPNKSLVVLKLVSDKDLPLYGEEVKAGGDEEIIAEDIETGFTDIENTWAKNEIAKMADLGVVNGKSEAQFAPDDDVTRAEFAAMVCRMLEFDTDYTSSYFSDVDKNAWYMSYVNAAQVEGILKGDVGKTFRPDDSISIEEVAAATNRICRKYEVAAENVNADEILSKFVFENKISGWARDDVATAVKYGTFYRMYETGYLDASKNATRAETASMLYRVYNLVK